ncbi:hypothetical protein K490DRAFT_38448 [Saccharata proteae CBS 121410]|uniref:Uncharacterized protein n=1 Tax=Saccharata proteae CBS 121410 TaxID=1314787 RepID=A0A6A5YE43_9PEZI|nr:hypothetical protein K490DRAFT_38448 [Saccharata proteae CBS 121410]
MSHEWYRKTAKQVSKDDTSAGSVLQALDSPSLAPGRAREILSSLAYNLLTHPPVFITSKLLSYYVTTSSILQDQSHLPEILNLYATKPVPKPGSSPIQYTNPNPKAVSQAIPAKIANTAIDAAILSKNLPLALSVIECTFRAPAYRRSLLVRKVLPSALGLGLAPLAAMALAQQFAKTQQVVDPQSATQFALMGLLTYIGVVTTVGFVAVTTSNDQMDRVTWAPGMALSERWFREEERAATDRVAQAWGFNDVARKGDEEGPEWEELREWAGLRGMILDQVELMEGMN